MKATQYRFNFTCRDNGSGQYNKLGLPTCSTCLTPPDDGLPVTSRNAVRRRGKPPYIGWQEPERRQHGRNDRFPVREAAANGA